MDGIDNFVRMAEDQKFWGSVQITLVYVLVGTPIKLAAALAVAMLLNFREPGHGLLPVGVLRAIPDRCES